MELIDFILHVDEHLLEFITQYGVWIYAILFLIIFVETGLVVMPFLPGDSLLFAAGALAASTGVMDPWILGILLFTAAVLGDTLNYHIGKYIGPRVFELESRFINKKHLIETQKFFERHGGKTIIFARFVPFARTFAPFVAGAGSMNYKYFLTYNVIGAFLLDRVVYYTRLFVWQYANCERQFHPFNFRHYYFKCLAWGDWFYSPKTQEKTCLSCEILWACLLNSAALIHSK